MKLEGPDLDCFTGQRANAHFFYGSKNSFSGFKPCYESNIYRYRSDFRRFEYEKDPLVFMSACRPGCEEAGWMFSTRIVDNETENEKILPKKTPLLKAQLQLDVEFQSISGIAVYGNAKAAVNIFTISDNLEKAVSPKTWTFNTGIPEGKVCAIDQDPIAHRLTCQKLIATCDDPSDIINVSVNTAGNFELYQKTCGGLYAAYADNIAKMDAKYKLGE